MSHPSTKCRVKGCANHSSEGHFVGDICLPCYESLKTGNFWINSGTIFGNEQRELLKWREVFGHLGNNPDEVGNVIIKEMDRLRDSYPDWIVPDLEALAGGVDCHGSMPPLGVYLLFKVQGCSSIKYGLRDYAGTAVILSELYTKQKYHINAVTGWMRLPKNTDMVENKVHNWVWVDETGDLCFGTTPHPDFVSVPLTPKTLIKGELRDLLLRQVKESPELYRELNSVFPRPRPTTKGN